MTGKCINCGRDDRGFGGDICIICGSPKVKVNSPVVAPAKIGATHASEVHGQPKAQRPECVRPPVELTGAMRSVLEALHYDSAVMVLNTWRMTATIESGPTKARVQWKTYLGLLSQGCIRTERSKNSNQRAYVHITSRGITAIS